LLIETARKNGTSQWTIRNRQSTIACQPMKSDSTTQSQPDASQFRFPAEWEPHAATWLAWPHFRGDWPGKFEPIRWVYAEIIRNLARHERVELIVNDAVSEKRAKKILQRADALSANVRFHRWPTDRVWTRDSGCTFVMSNSITRNGAATAKSKSRASGTWKIGPSGPSLSASAKRALVPGPLAAIKWRFNAWAKYSNWKKDETIGTRMAKSAEAVEIRPTFLGQRLVLEGGSIDSNGQGTLLTSEECLLSTEQQRNPGMGREDYEKVFRDYLGINNVIWLGKGIVGDDTHGHVDDISRFVAPDTVVSVAENDPGDPNYAALQDNLRRLRSATDQDGRPFRVIELPMPSPVVFEGRRLPASYGNFYIANGIVLVPVFNDPNDRIALNILSDLFPNREVVGIYSGDLIWGFGAMHCMTQQQPVAGPQLLVVGCSVINIAPSLST
jgi:agmatine deiminase